MFGPSGLQLLCPSSCLPHSRCVPSLNSRIQLNAKVVIGAVATNWRSVPQSGLCLHLPSRQLSAKVAVWVQAILKINTQAQIGAGHHVVFARAGDAPDAGPAGPGAEIVVNPVDIGRAVVQRVGRAGQVELVKRPAVGEGDRDLIWPSDAPLIAALGREAGLAQGQLAGFGIAQPFGIGQQRRRASKSPVWAARVRNCAANLPDPFEIRQTPGQVWRVRNPFIRQQTGSFSFILVP